MKSIVKSGSSQSGAAWLRALLCLPALAASGCMLRGCVTPVPPACRDTPVHCGADQQMVCEQCAAIISRVGDSRTCTTDLCHPAGAAICRGAQNGPQLGCVSGHCAAVGDTGAQCATDADCATGLYCFDNVACPSGHPLSSPNPNDPPRPVPPHSCQPLALGENSECDSNYDHPGCSPCMPGLVCDHSVGIGGTVSYCHRACNVPTATPIGSVVVSSDCPCGQYQCYTPPSLLPHTLAHYCVTCRPAGAACGSDGQCCGVYGDDGACVNGHCGGSPDVLTHRYDNSRAGAYLLETQLTPANVRPGTFGPLGYFPVDDAIDAQPLYVSRLRMSDGLVHDVVYVATRNNSVYAFDADRPSTVVPPAVVRPLAQHLRLDAIPAAIPVWSDGHVRTGFGGIIGTPVIDRQRDLLYVVTSGGGPAADQTFFHLHALNLIDLTDAITPIAIQTPAGATPALVPVRQKQRPGLLLTRGMLYIAFGVQVEQVSECWPYHGWLFVYDTNQLDRPPAYFLTTGARGSGGGGAGIWQSGHGIAGDALGHAYFMTANKTNATTAGSSCSADAPANVSGAADYSQSFIRVGPNAQRDWSWSSPGRAADHVPSGADLNVADCDLGSSGPVLLPDTPWLIGGGKEGRLFLLSANTGALISDLRINPDSGFNVLDQNTFPVIGSAPVFWRSRDSAGTVTSRLFVWTEKDVLRSFSLADNAAFAPLTVAPGPANQSTGAGMLWLTANGADPHSGVLWATQTVGGDDDAPIGELRAYDATDLCRHDGILPCRGPIYSDRGSPGWLTSYFTPPLAIRGKVYVATRGTITTPGNHADYGVNAQVRVYGLLTH